MRDRDAKQRWQALYRARMNAPQERQNALGPREHGAWAEHRVRENPVYGVLEQLLAVPGYTAAKGVGLLGGRSAPGLDELAEGYRGIGRGVAQNFQDAGTSVGRGLFELLQGVPMLPRNTGQANPKRTHLMKGTPQAGAQFGTLAQQPGMPGQSTTGEPRAARVDRLPGMGTPY